VLMHSVQYAEGEPAAARGGDAAGAQAGAAAVEAVSAPDVRGESSRELEAFRGCGVLERGVERLAEGRGVDGRS
jgi:hypothetical protein